MPLAYSYKDDFGAAGLTGHLRDMQYGVIDAYRRLHRSGSINRIEFAGLRLWSGAKYLRRWLLSRLERR